MVAAERLERSWIGIDIEPMALSVLQQRFKGERIDVDFEVDGLPSTSTNHLKLWSEMAVSEPKRFERAAITRIPGCTPWRDLQNAGLGIDGIVKLSADAKRVGHAVVRVTGRDPSDPSPLRDLRRSTERRNQHGLDAALLIYVSEPAPELQMEAKQTGEIEVGGVTHQRLSVASLNQVFDQINRNQPVLPLLPKLD